jgi:purine-nucleoside phosphorylase
MSYEQLQEAAAFIAETTGKTNHDIAVVLGSGLSDYAASLPDAQVVPYQDIPHFPLPSVHGHTGHLVSTTVGNNRVLIFAGRVHLYEGRPLWDTVFGVRTAILSGCHTYLVTNAAGGCGEGFQPGDLTLISDHLNLTGQNPLMGANDERLGTRFPDMSSAYDPQLRELARTAADEVGVDLKEGIYAWFTGPTYETPAEVRMAMTMGADLVGMSTVPEVIAARHMGAKVLGISLVTNLAAGIADHPLSHAEVAEEGRAAAERFSKLVNTLLPRL